jgi:hypothetical protein
MKNITLPAMIIAFITLSMSVTAQPTRMKEKDDKIKVKMKGSMQSTNNSLYTPTYSSDFAISSSGYSNLILKAWKDFENNTLDNSATILADSMTSILANGTILKGKDNFINAIKGYRSSFSGMETSVAAWTNLKSLDKNKDIVCIWGQEKAKKSDGTSKTTVVHELWFFNAAGKVDLFRQFTEGEPHQ